MEIKKGIGVSPGVVISTAIVLDAEDLLIPKRAVDPSLVETEVRRFHEAIASSVADLIKLRDETAAKHGKEIGGIFDFHIGILHDKSILTQIVKEIRSKHTTAEYAVAQVCRKYAKQFAEMSDTYLRERVKDIYDIERRVLHALIGQKRE